MISLGGEDRSKAHFIAPNILSFLRDHYNKLSTNWYFDRREEIESFPNDPLSQGAYGSVTVTNGVKIEAVAKYIHIFSAFDD